MKKVNPKSLKNLKPARRGEVRNPNGRPKNTLPDLKQALSETLTHEDVCESLAAIIALAKQGDVGAAGFIFDRTFGKVKESLALEQKTVDTDTILIRWEDV